MQWKTEHATENRTCHVTWIFVSCFYFPKSVLYFHFFDFGIKWFHWTAVTFDLQNPWSPVLIHLRQKLKMAFRWRAEIIDCTHMTLWVKEVAVPLGSRMWFSVIWSSSVITHEAQCSVYYSNNLKNLFKSFWWDSLLFSWLYLQILFEIIDYAILQSSIIADTWPFILKSFPTHCLPVTRRPD